MPPKKNKSLRAKKEQRKQYKAKMRLKITTEKLEKKRAINRRKNMSLMRITKKQAADRPENMSLKRLTRKQATDRPENMSLKRLTRKQATDRPENMSEGRLEKKRAAQTHGNISKERLKKKLAANKHQNMSENRLKKKLATDRKENMSQERIKRIRAASRSKLHAVERPSEDAISRLAARRENARMANRLYQQQLQAKQLQKDCEIYGISEEDIMFYENMETECLAGPSNESTVFAIARNKNALMNNQLYQQKILSEKPLQQYTKRSGMLKQNMMLDEIVEIPCLARLSHHDHHSITDFSAKIHAIPAESRLKTQFLACTEECNYMESVENVQKIENVKKSIAISRKRKKKVEFAGDITNGSYLTVEKYTMGDLTIKCPYCGAIRFTELKGRAVHTCCHNGKIMLPPLNEYPPELENLLKSENEESKNFKQHIRAYNSSFSFVTFGAHIEEMQGKAPPLIKIQGQVYHHATTSLTNVDGNAPRNGQIYIYENIEEAAKMRLDIDNQNLNLRLENLLRRINPYAQKYKMLHEMTNSGENTYMLHFIKYEFDDKRRYNTPTASEIAIIVVSKDGCLPCVDLKVYPKQENGRETTILSQASQHADPMTFPLLFPHGDLGWTYNMSTNEGNKITPAQYYGHRLALRPDEQFNPLLNAGRLTQQYVINCYVMVERQRLDFIRHNQRSLRMECYQGIVDHIENNSLNEANQVRLGNAVILPATYIGSPRCLQQLYQDSMAICRKIGRPDFFITMTCNPKWPEITNTLKKYFVNGTAANDIPMIVTNVFQIKINELIHDLMEEQVLGPIVAYVYTIEFQKRGLPHAHILAALRTDCKLLNPEDIDRYITAELSDQDSSLRYYQLRHMMHGPHFDQMLCWNKEKKECSKKFPKPFRNETDMTGDGFPKYRRRDNMEKLYAYHAKVKGKVQYVDNRMVVPHNPYLLKKFDCHINVEYCSSEMALKYIHKYIHKGHDRARMEMKKNETNEVQKYIDSRYIGPMEAAWRLNLIPLHNRSHTVIRLPVHLDGQQYVTFEEGHEKNALNKDCKTMLLGWFDLNKQDKVARNILYGNIPESYAWNKSEKKWTPRDRSSKVVGRIVNVSPRDSERFFLKLILNRISGATSHEDLRTYQGIIYRTYREAAIAMGITENSNEANAVLEEAATTLMARQFRRFFVYYLIGDEPSNALQLWEKFQDEMTEHEETTYNSLCEIEAQLNAENRTCSDFGLPEPAFFKSPVKVLDIQHHIEISENNEKRLNAGQLSVYTRIIDCISGGSENPAQCFFIDGPGGTGKTFLYNAIYHKLLSMNKKIACVAWTGIASILLPCGMTSHRFFNLPIRLEEESICFLKARDKLRLQEVDVVIWDEASMIPRKALETISRTLCDVMNSTVPFGGKTFILGGDFRQTLPVVKKATRRQIVDECIKSSPLWAVFEIHHLKINMRVNDTEENFAEWLLQLGNGEITELCVDNSSAFHCSDLTNWFFEDVSHVDNDLLSRIILSPQNDEVNKMNESILSRIPGELFVSYSIDKATLNGIDKSDAREEEATLRYSDEYLHSLTPSGMPPHKLKLKVGCIVMLIRNLSIADGLCNGTRLLVQRILRRVLTAKIITGDKKGSVVDIPRIQLNTSTGHSQLPFVLYRRQFPVRMAYALTINKAQGQTFERVGIYIDRPLFSHGQLYVALSRCVSGQNIKILIKNAEKIENIVYNEIL